MIGILWDVCFVIVFVNVTVFLFSRSSLFELQERIRTLERATTCS